jgi:lactate dehydrogenase-like 2-hydroxyacid dehydrogenase
MDISYHNRTPRTDVPYRYVDSLTDLAPASTALVVAAARGASSVELISAEVLNALGPQGYLVNVARGSVVDEDALVAALLEGTIAGAALDVYANEPHVPSQLLTMDTVVLLPHLGSGTRQTRQAMADLVIHNLTSLLQNGRLITPVVLAP